MSSPLQSTTILVDIEPPVLPAESDISIFFAGLTLLIIMTVLIILSIRNYISPRSKARRHIQRLEKTINSSNPERYRKNNAIDVKKISYQLARIFATGVDLNGVTASSVLPVELNPHLERWKNFTRDLSLLRYDQQYTRQVSLDKLFLDSLFFLRNWP